MVVDSLTMAGWPNRVDVGCAFKTLIPCETAKPILYCLRRFSRDDYSSGRHILCFTCSPHRTGSTWSLMMIRQPLCVSIPTLQTLDVIENGRIASPQKINWINRTVTETWNISDRVENFQPWMILLWLAGVIIYAIKLSGGLFWAANLRQLTANVCNPKLDDLVNALTSRLSIKRKIQICESSLINIPMTIGWIYPLILIPPGSLLGLTGYQLQTIIAHELIHIKRYDFLINVLQSVAEILLFYHPAVFWTSRKIREEREYICDDLTVALCKDSTGYARALTKIARFQRQAEQLAVAATDGELKDRIYRLVSNSPNPGFNKKSILPSVWAIVVISLFLTVMFGGLKVLSNNKESDLKKPISCQCFGRR